MENYQSKQDLLLEEVENEVQETSYVTGVSKLSFKVLNAFKKVSRHLFVPYEKEDCAYSNRPLPIGEGQTISQPFIVAIMTELLDVRPTDKVLEIGTGSGYQAAVLSKLASEVYSVEIFSSLAKQAQQRFRDLGYKNVHVLIGNGTDGWVENAPYHKIIVTAAAEEIPDALIGQLSPGGIMIIPIGKQNREQFLTLVKKGFKGELSQKSVLPVAFVPFIRSKKS